LNNQTTRIEETRTIAKNTTKFIWEGEPSCFFIGLALLFNHFSLETRKESKRELSKK